MEKGPLYKLKAQILASIEVSTSSVLSKSMYMCRLSVTHTRNRRSSTAIQCVIKYNPKLGYECIYIYYIYIFIYVMCHLRVSLGWEYLLEFRERMETIFS